MISLRVEITGRYSMIFCALKLFNPCFYTESAICLALYEQVKIYLVLHGTSKTIRCCISGGVYQMRMTRP
jgi:hypothetical protein